MKKIIKSNFVKREKGQSLVELAISLMIMLLLLLGAVEFSLALFQYVTIRDAAQEGAVYGSIKPEDESGIKYRATAAASDVVQLDPNDPNQIQITRNNNKSCEGLTPVTSGVPPVTKDVPNSITVTITFAHPITFPIVGPMIGSNSNTINLRASVTNTILTPTCPLP